MRYSSNDSGLKKALTLILIVVLVGVLAYSWYTSRPAKNGISGIREPIQTPASGSAQFAKAGYDVNITYKYAYDIEGLVVHTHRYNGLGIGDRLAPVDIALAWGKVAEYNDRIDFHWSQANRYVLWETDTYEEIAPVGYEKGVNKQCSNNHVIPADSSIRNKLKSIKAGSRVRIKGYLVNVKATKSNGTYFTWNSSVTRDDSGGGACEVIYVTEVQVLS